MYVTILEAIRYPDPPAKGDRVRFGAKPVLTHNPTFADIVLLVCYLYVAVLIVVSLKVQHLEESDEDGTDKLAQRINSLACRALPVAAVLALGTAVLVLWFWRYARSMAIYGISGVRS